MILDEEKHVDRMHGEGLVIFQPNVAIVGSRYVIKLSHAYLYIIDKKKELNPTLPYLTLYQTRQTQYKKRKPHTNIPHEYRCRNSQQNTSRLNLAVQGKR